MKRRYALILILAYILGILFDSQLNPCSVLDKLVAKGPKVSLVGDQFLDGAHACFKGSLDHGNIFRLISNILGRSPRQPGHGLQCRFIMVFHRPNKRLCARGDDASNKCVAYSEITATRFTVR